MHIEVAEGDGWKKIVSLGGRQSWVSENTFLGCEDVVEKVMLKIPSS